MVFENFPAGNPAGRCCRRPPLAHQGRETLAALRAMFRGYGVANLLRGLDRLIGQLVAAAEWLALLFIGLLFLQWPLRDVVPIFSREANDLGQVVFAFFVAASVTAATRAKTHLAADFLARHYGVRVRRRLHQLGTIAGLLPWALFVLIA